MEMHISKKISTWVIIGVLILLSVIIVRPIFLAIIGALLLAYIFNPLYKKVLRVMKEKTLAALIVCFIALLIIFIPIWFFTPIIFEQLFNLYTELQKLNLVSIVKETFPSLFSSDESTKQFVIALNSFISQAINALLKEITDLLTSLPTLLLEFVIVLFIFFYSLRDQDKLAAYIKSISPFSQESQEKIVEKFKAVTSSVLYGHLIVGIVQGVATGIGLFVLGVPNAGILTLLAVFFSILPVIGAWLVWFPAAIFLLIQGNTFAGVALLLYGAIFVSWIDNVIRPYIVARKSDMNSGLVLIAMIGGLLVFGILGLVLGPLIIAYTLSLLDQYKEKKLSLFFSAEQK